MRYKIDSILELAKHLDSLNTEERYSVLNFLHGNNTSANHKDVYYQLESLSTETESNVILSKADINRRLSRFKKKLEEYQLTEKSVLFLRDEDEHAYQQIRLSKKVLSAQVFIDQGMVINAINILVAAFKKAEEHEFLALQKEIAQKLQRLNQQISKTEAYLIWKTKLFSINGKIERFTRLANTFNAVVNEITCCDHHKTVVNRDSLFPFQMTYKATGLLKVKWMRSFLRAHMYRNQGEHGKAQKIAWSLLSLYNENLVIFSRQYYLILMQFILENMYALNKVHVVQRASNYVSVLRSMPIYQKIHLLYLHMYEQFRLENAPVIEYKIERLLKDPTLTNYQHIKQHLAVFEAHVLLLNGSYVNCLKEINCNLYLRNIKCCRMLADLKSLELICLLHLGQEVLLHDKIEAFRKFTARNSDYEGINY